MPLNEITIATLNTFGGTLHIFTLIQRYKAIATYFNKSHVDVIHFQEVFTYYHLFLLKKELSKFPYLVCHGSFLGPKGGLVTFSRYPLENSRSIDFKRQSLPFLASSAVELLIQRGMLISEVKLQKNLLILLNSHFTAVQNRDWSKNSIYFKELKSEINQFHAALAQCDPRNIVIAVGDFNIAKGSDLYKKLQIPSFLHDVFHDDDSTTLVPQFSSKISSPIRIDYIFCYGEKTKYQLKKRQTLFTKKVKLGTGVLDFVSDHYGLAAVVKIKH